MELRLNSTCMPSWRAQGTRTLLTPCSYTRIWLSIYSQTNPTHTISNVHSGWEQLFVSYSRGHRLVSKRRRATGLRYFVVFLSTAKQIPAQNITLGHDVFLPHPFQFICALFVPFDALVWAIDNVVTRNNKYRVIQNECRSFNNLSYTIHLRQEYRYFFLFNRTTLQVFVTYLTGALYVHPLWFYKQQHDNR